MGGKAREGAALSTYKVKETEQVGDIKARELGGVWCSRPIGGDPLLTCLLYFQVRAEVLTTYALCGFANFSSIGIMLGGLSESCGGFPRALEN